MDRVFAKLRREGIPIDDEGDIIEWTGEALAHIGAIPYYEEAISFIEVRNHQAPLPNGFHQLVQLARNNCWQPNSEDNLCPATVMNAVCSSPGSGGGCGSPGNPCPPNSMPIPLDCKGMPMQTYELAYYRPYFDLQAEYYVFGNTAMYAKCFTQIRLATSSFGLPLKPPGRENDAIYGQDGSTYNTGVNRDEYIMVNKEILRFTFRSGHVAIGYLRNPIDDTTGYPLVPDEVSYLEAVTSYIAWQRARREFRQGREGSAGRLDRAERDWQWYCKQAGSKDMMIYGVDEHQNFYDSRTRLIPNDRQYYSFFGKMSRPEGRKFDDPDYRNYSVSYFRGVGGNLNY